MAGRGDQPGACRPHHRILATRRWHDPAHFSALYAPRLHSDSSTPSVDRLPGLRGRGVGDDGNPDLRRILPAAVRKPLNIDRLPVGGVWGVWGGGGWGGGGGVARDRGGPAKGAAPVYRACTPCERRASSFPAAAQLPHAAHLVAISRGDEIVGMSGQAAIIF